MTRDDYDQAKDVFLAAVQLSPSQRTEYVAQACAGNEALRREVESLLAFHDTETILPERNTSSSTKTVTDLSFHSFTTAASPSFLHLRASRIIGDIYSRLFGNRARRVMAILLACAFLIGVEAVVYQFVQRSIQQNIRGDFTTLLAADVKALSVWFRLHEATAQATAADPAVQSDSQKLLALARSADNPTAAILSSPDLRQLREEMQPLLAAYDYQGFVIIDTNRRIVAASEDSLIGTDALMTRALRSDKGPLSFERPFVTLPFGSSIPLRDKDGQERAGVPTMFAVAPLYDQHDEPVAALCLRIRPQHEFTQILNVANAGKTGETFAFDRQGRLLSESRFDEQLKDIGLLVDQPHSNSILQLELRDPGADLTKGRRPTQRRADMPFMESVAEAIAGRSGLDVSGHRDYRGVLVVGAWTWLEDLQFGVATKQDASEAFAPLRYLHWLNAGVMLVLTLSLATTLYSAFFSARLGNQLSSLRQVGPYRLETLIGEGGMGQVYLAHHDLLRRPTAVKLLKPGRTTARDIARFDREVQSASRLTCPHTIEIYDFGRTDEGQFFCAMEYLPGVTLEGLLRQDGPVPVPRTLHILRQVCRSLNEAHRKGVIHRDIKPQNIMLCERGGEYDFVKVLDFGLAKNYRDTTVDQITKDMRIVGTPLFIAPEILLGRGEPNPLVDIYSFGVVAYNLLTGRDPYFGESLNELIHDVLHRELPSPSQTGRMLIPAKLDELITRCLSKNPDRRPQSMEEILTALEDDMDLARWTQADARTWWDAHELSATIAIG